MKKASFPYIALFFCLPMLAIVLPGAISPEGGFALPLLTLLIISEFGMVVTGIGAFIGWQTMQLGSASGLLVAASVICALLSVTFLALVINLFP